MRRDLPIAFYGFLVSAFVCAGFAIFAGARGDSSWAIIAAVSALGCVAVAGLLSRPRALDVVDSLGPETDFLSGIGQDAMHGDTFIPPEPPAPGREHPGIAPQIDVPERGPKPPGRPS
jgi:hypothetical protein